MRSCSAFAAVVQVRLSEADRTAAAPPPRGHTPSAVSKKDKSKGT